MIISFLLPLPKTKMTMENYHFTKEMIRLYLQMVAYFSIVIRYIFGGYRILSPKRACGLESWNFAMQNTNVFRDRLSTVCIEHLQLEPKEHQLPNFHFFVFHV